MKRCRWLILVVLAGCGGGGSPKDAYVGNWTGTWRNTSKGLSGTLTATYDRSPGMKFDVIFRDAAGNIVFEGGDREGNDGWVALYPGGATIAQGPGFQHYVNTPQTQAVFTADRGFGAYAGSKFEADLSKAP